MNRSSLIHWLLTAQAGSELNLKIMKLKQMVNFQVILDVFLLATYLLSRNGRLWRVGCETIFKSQPRTRISNQFSRIILARIGSRHKFSIKNREHFDLLKNKLTLILTEVRLIANYNCPVILRCFSVGLCDCYWTYTISKRVNRSERLIKDISGLAGRHGILWRIIWCITYDIDCSSEKLLTFLA